MYLKIPKFLLLTLRLDTSTPGMVGIGGLGISIKIGKLGQNMTKLWFDNVINEKKIEKKKVMLSFYCVLDNIEAHIMFLLTFITKIKKMV